VLQRGGEAQQLVPVGRDELRAELVTQQFGGLAGWSGAVLGKGVRGGSAPVRAYIPELLEDVLEDEFNSGRVLDFETDLDGVAEAYAAMDERRAIKSLLRVGTI
jgi:Zn-dependent alcohol dehydrogenase